MTHPINLCRIAPSGYLHQRAFDEIAETLENAIRDLGHPVAVCSNVLPATGLNIVLGAHLLDRDAAEKLGPETVVYNFEQIDVGSGWTRPELLAALRRATVWDYSLSNLEWIRSFTGNPRLQHVPIGYTSSLTRIPAATFQDIDVLFYGSLNTRRVRILDQVAERVPNLHRAFGVYGDERDSLIARAKVVLNMHFYAARVFEMVRVSYLLANSKAVVSEAEADTETPDGLGDAVRLARSEELAEACAGLVGDANARGRYEEAGFRWMSSRPAREFVRRPLNAAIGGAQAE